jgi:hypothetical protein
MPVTGAARSGKGSRISANGTNLNQSEWNTDFKGDDLDTTVFESQGYDEGTIGIEGVDWDFKGRWDAIQNFYNSPPGIFPQDQYPNLIFYESVSDNVFWLVTLARILSAKNGATVRGLVTFESSGKSNGSFVIP